MLQVRDLQIIQHKLRNIEQIPTMVDFVKDGGMFTADSIVEYEQRTQQRVEDKAVSGLVEIAILSDNTLFLHNGHHRVVSICLAGREFISQDEFYTKRWDYKDYDDIVFTDPDGSWRGYVTPFDIRTEARTNDIGAFKTEVKHIYDTYGELAAREFILNNKNMYAIKKECHMLTELATNVNDELSRTLGPTWVQQKYQSVG